MAEPAEVRRKKLLLVLSGSLILWWGIRWGTVGLWSFEVGITVGVMLHFLLLLSTSFIFGIERIEAVSFIERFKSSLKPSVLYALLAAGSTVLFHHGLQAEHTALRQLERERFIEQSLADDASYLALQENDPGLVAIPREEARQRALDSLKFQFDPRWHFTAALLLWISAAMTTALFTSGLCQWLRS